MSFSFASDYDLSTRTRYGAYLNVRFVIVFYTPFQLALTTECIQVFLISQ